jgi:peroxiredoxin
VVTRGFPGSICMFCSAQTAMLIKNHDEFVKRGAELLVVFPGPKEHLGAFTRSARSQAESAAVPFRLLLDPDFKAVDQLGIRAELAKPSTYILDKQGQVRFAYVGASLSDRPSLKAMLGQLDQINAGGG